ncbi:hypothetical protein [Xanthocytophaga agilis]|uniref:Uncharacterized protein n=1 Tax=Xanthocytophaga agilis TaxID=3048010 RepID=A0AAE3R8V4_9BACT|nr:hypothetical protein [Xanthocytophaga agilis]MDJ1503589.1 hypothetical protein [Xanthocytophaga agilis]
MRIKDAINLHWSDVYKYHIAYYPSKTVRFKKKIVVPITEPLKKILAQYKAIEKETDGFVTMTNKRYPLILQPGQTKPEAEQMLHDKRVSIYNK